VFDRDRKRSRSDFHTFGREVWEARTWHAADQGDERASTLIQPPHTENGDKKKVELL
jgi:hypothetical protein